MRAYEERLKDASDKFTVNISEIRTQYEEWLNETKVQNKWKLKDLEGDLTRRFHDQESNMKRELEHLKYSSSEKETKMKLWIEELEKLHKEVETAYEHIWWEFELLSHNVKRWDEKRKRMKERMV